MAPGLPYPMRLLLHPMEHPIPEGCHPERVRNKPPQIVNTVGALDMGVDVTRNWGRLYFAVALSAAQVLVSERIIRSPLAKPPIFFVPQHVANRALHDCRPRQMACAARSEQKWLQTGESPGCHVECHVCPGFRSQDLHSAEHPFPVCALRHSFCIGTNDQCKSYNKCLHTGLEWAGTQPSTNQKAVANAARLQ